MKRIGVLTSGGDAPGMNASIRAVVKQSYHLDIEVLGIYGGFNGLIEGLISPLNLNDVGNIIQKGGTILRSSRSDFFKTKEGLQIAYEQVKKNNIDGVIVIGGEGSCNGAKYLNDNKVPTITIPATIDNDMPSTQFTLGFDTALNTIINAIDKIRDTANSHERVYIIEVMGRNSGNVALWSGVSGGAESVVIPEKDTNIDEINRKLNQTYERGKKSSIIILAEGKSEVDNLSNTLRDKSGFEIKNTVLGHLQRGGSPSAFDRMLGSKWGVYAINSLKNKGHGDQLGIINNKLIKTPYNKLVYSDEYTHKENIYKLVDILSI